MSWRCSYCGMAIGTVPYVREAEAYCCEGCYLEARMRGTVVLREGDVQWALAEVLVAALDAREHETGLHSKRVACHTVVLARRFTADGEELHQVYLGALLHDVGKIGIPDAILGKEGPLSETEWQVMRGHPEIGHRILAGVGALEPAGEIVLAHEERYDGSGYPRGLAGEAIPLWARLFSLVDALDAMISDRPYRKALAFEAASAEIVRQAGTQFDPLAVDAFLGAQATLRAMAQPAFITMKGSNTMKVTDPVCGMSIDSEKAKASETYQGNTYYFCCPHCQSAFKADAAKFAAQASHAGHGVHHHHG